MLKVVDFFSLFMQKSPDIYNVFYKSVIQVSTLKTRNFKLWSTIVLTVKDTYFQDNHLKQSQEKSKIKIK